MNILLITPDSKIPNLAIMKIAAYHRAKGDNVGFHIGNPDIIYASIIFKENKPLAASWPYLYPDAELIIGGPGWDPAVQLPAEIDSCSPDYTIYPAFNGSIGRVTIGCPRRCYFCVVHKMPARKVQHIKYFYRGGTCRLLDDNILAFKDAWRETANYIIKNDILPSPPEGGGFPTQHAQLKTQPQEGGRY